VGPLQEGRRLRDFQEGELHPLQGKINYVCSGGSTRSLWRHVKNAHPKALGIPVAAGLEPSINSSAEHYPGGSPV